MRNILEYPITNKERIDVLKDIKENILAEESVGDLRAYVIQECIDTIQSNHTNMQLSADDTALAEIVKLHDWISNNQKESRNNITVMLEQAGFKPGMWSIWANDPAPLETYSNKNYDILMLAILDALTQEGITAWPGDAVACVAHMIRAQITSRKRLLGILTRISNSIGAESEDLRELARDALLEENSQP